MPCPSHKPYEPMLIIKPNQLPAFWWLNPWHHAKRLSKTVFALRDYADAHDDRLTIAKSELQEAGESIAHLQRKVREITEDREFHKAEAKRFEDLSAEWREKLGDVKKVLNRAGDFGEESTTLGLAQYLVSDLIDLRERFAAVCEERDALRPKQILTHSGKPSASWKKPKAKPAKKKGGRK